MTFLGNFASANAFAAYPVAAATLMALIAIFMSFSNSSTRTKLGWISTVVLIVAVIGWMMVWSAMALNPSLQNEIHYTVELLYKGSKLGIANREIHVTAQVATMLIALGSLSFLGYGIIRVWDIASAKFRTPRLEVLHVSEEAVGSGT